MPSLTGKGALRSARQHALNLGAEHGWTVHLHHGVHRALGLLLKDLPDGQRVSYSHLRERLAGTHLPMRRTAEILAALGLLVEDRQDTIRLWADRRASELPDGFRAAVHGWLLWLSDGDARTQPRALGTLHSYFSSVRPIVERWATNRSHLREVTREDVLSTVAGLRGSQYTGAVTALRSLFRYAKKYGRVFANPMRGVRVGRRPPGSVLPMSDAEISHVQQTAQAAAPRLAVTLAAVHAAGGEAIRSLLLEDLDFSQGRITLDGNVQPMADLTRTALRAWLDERRSLWPHTLNRHVLLSRVSANGTGPVSPYFLQPVPCVRWPRPPMRQWSIGPLLVERVMRRGRRAVAMKCRPQRRVSSLIQAHSSQTRAGMWTAQACSVRGHHNFDFTVLETFKALGPKSEIHAAELTFPSKAAATILRSPFEYPMSVVDAAATSGGRVATMYLADVATQARWFPA